jgi:hypothetical protein
MPTPNVIGYVTEVVEERDANNQPTLRFKLRIRNTLGQERIVWSIPEHMGDLEQFLAKDGAL